LKQGIHARFVWSTYFQILDWSIVSKNPLTIMIYIDIIDFC